MMGCNRFSAFGPTECFEFDIIIEEGIASIDLEIAGRVLVRTGVWNKAAAGIGVAADW